MLQLQSSVWHCIETAELRGSVRNVVFSYLLKILMKFQWRNSNKIAKYKLLMRGKKSCNFAISRNYTRQGRIYYGTPVGSHILFINADVLERPVKVISATGNP